MLGLRVSAALLSLQVLHAGFHRLFIRHLGDRDITKCQIARKHLASLVGVSVDH